MKKLKPEKNKFHVGNGSDGKHYWLTPNDVMQKLQDEFVFDFDPCPLNFNKGDGLLIPWGKCNFVNPPYSNLPAWVKKCHFVSRTIALDATLQIARLNGCPSCLACRSAAKVSAVSPDCETTTISVLGFGIERR